MGDRHPVSRVTRYLGTNYKVQTKVIRVFLLHKQGNGNTSFFFWLRIVILVDSIKKKNKKKEGQYYLFYLLTKKMRRYRYDGGL